MTGSWLTIGEAAKACGLSAKMIRHYEAAGLLAEPVRSHAGYRLYSPTQLAQLHFIRQARLLNFSLPAIQSLLTLWQNPNRASADVKLLAQQHLAEVAQTIAQLQQLQQRLTQQVAQCDGNAQPHCAILQTLATTAGLPVKSRSKQT